MELSSFKVGEYAIDVDGEVVEILEKKGHKIKFKIIVQGEGLGCGRVGTIRNESGDAYGRGNEISTVRSDSSNE